MKKKLLLLLLVHIFVVSCQDFKVNYRVVGLEEVLEDMEESIINNSFLFRNKTAATISVEEIESVTQFLIEAVVEFNEVQSSNKRTKNDLINIKNYHCNYLPLKNHRGETIVRIIAARANFDDPWYGISEILQKKDGYISVFQFTLNLSTNQRGKIRPNGEA